MLTYEVSSLDKTKAEPDSDQATVALASSGRSRYGTPNVLQQLCTGPEYGNTNHTIMTVGR